ncbi:SDR family NAD(P)-dependent oxidoreductase [Paraburkholderia strydomiana]|uniref:SDR family NAD(P)-dependent oxidoreductase n=1 Tax=Paraburkholderia strydomiana TaxID=1245417 RepID=UPI0038B8B6C5
MSRTETALIVGAGKGLSASVARLFATEGMQVALAARDTTNLLDLVDETGALALNCDASRPEDVKALFDRVEDTFGAPDIVVYNASGRYRAAVEDIDPEKLENALKVTAVGGFLVAQAASVRMLTRGNGTILLTGATASVKGLLGSTPFAMGQIRSARDGSMHGARTRPKEYSRCAFCD